jgi:CHAD domain-containing protein
VNEPDEQLRQERIRSRAYEISRELGSGTPEENWLRAEVELSVVHDYDTIDRDLERLGITLSRIPLEVGVTWRLQLPRGEWVEAWEPGSNGLVPPAEVASLIDGVIAGRELIPMVPLSSDPGAIRLREMIDVQRRELLAHDPGTRLGDDPENLHKHRVAARRTRAFLRATRAQIDPAWRRTIVEPLRRLGEVTGPVRDLDVLLEHLRDELGTLEDADQAGAAALVARLEAERAAATRSLLATLASDSYRALLWQLRFPPRLAPDVESVPLERIAQRQFRQFTKAVNRLGKHPDAATLHTLRITLKRARYATELLAPAGRASEHFLADAKTLQDLLGEHQNAVVAEQHLRTKTVHDTHTAAAFVAGRLSERQRNRREQVAERLPRAWRRLGKSGAALH